MAEQMGTPGSNADTSINGGRPGAPKDKSCPFCHQAFTSSSLGRHLDLYIKEKNPKPADGIHVVDEIRKLRQKITRRQPRVSISRREGSMSAETPGDRERRRSPPPEYGMGRKRSPHSRRESDDMFDHTGKPHFHINKLGWEATGVMNNIPMTRNGGSVQSWDGDDRDGMRRPDGRSRSVSKQVLAKTTFEQKEKMMEALDNAKAAELALRELLGSLRAAKQRIDGPSIFDYDPLSLDFPALTLYCLPPPPTLYQSTPIPDSTSWSILPPDDQQYQALRSHFSSEFHRWRVSCAIATTTSPDDFSYPPPPTLFTPFHDPAEIAQGAEAAATDLEAKISDHLHQVFAHWTSLSPEKRTEIWTIELARSVGRKAEEVQRLKREKDLSQQETAHLKLQVDELSRLQHPREFGLVSPSTLPFDAKVLAEVWEMGLRQTGIGFSVTDRNEHLDKTIERAIGRWKGVVREARGAGPSSGGLAAQRWLSGPSSAPAKIQAQTQTVTPTLNHTPTQPQHHHHHIPSPTKPDPPPNSTSNSNSNTHPQPHSSSKFSVNGNSIMNSTLSITNLTHEPVSDADADADADMVEVDRFVEMNSSGGGGGSGGEARKASASALAGFRLSNGNSSSSEREQKMGMEGLEGQSCVAGYLRIGA